MQYFGTKHTAKVTKASILTASSVIFHACIPGSVSKFPFQSFDRKNKTMCKLSKPSAVITQTSGQAQRPMTKVNQSNEIKHISYYLDATI